MNSRRSRKSGDTENLDYNLSIFVKHGTELRQSGGGALPELGKSRRVSGASLVSHGTVFGEMSQKYMTTANYKGSVVATKNILAKNIR